MSPVTYIHLWKQENQWFTDAFIGSLIKRLSLIKRSNKPTWNIEFDRKEKIGSDPFHTTGLFLYPLKTSENQRFSVFRGYRKRPVAWNGSITGSMMQRIKNNRLCFYCRLIENVSSSEFLLRRHLTESRQFLLKVTLEESSSLNERYLYGGFIVEFFTYFRQTGRK